MPSASCGRAIIGASRRPRPKSKRPPTELSLSTARAVAYRRMMAIDPTFDLEDFVDRVLAEDLGAGGDVTSAATIPAEAKFTARINRRASIIVAGIHVAAAFFRRVDPGVEIDLLASDGDRAEAGAIL